MTTATIKERPILFSGPMVRAILDGRKTQTRRIVKPAPPSIETIRKLSGSGFGLFNDRTSPPAVHRVTGPVWAVRETVGQTEWKCPYGQIGERLWVRETLEAVVDTKFDDSETMPIARYAADCSHIWTTGPRREPWLWKNRALPSIHMPRRLCRILLEITEVHAERLQDVTTDDIIAEGVQIPVTERGHPLIVVTGKCPPIDYLRSQNTPGSAPYTLSELLRAHWASLWDGINGAGEWASNPWVWAVSFKRIKP